MCPVLSKRVMSRMYSSVPSRGFWVMSRGHIGVLTRGLTGDE